MTFHLTSLYRQAGEHVYNHPPEACVLLPGYSCGEELQTIQMKRTTKQACDLPFCFTVSNDATRSDRDPGNVVVAGRLEACGAWLTEGGLSIPVLACSWVVDCCSVKGGALTPGGYVGGCEGMLVGAGIPGVDGC